MTIAFTVAEPMHPKWLNKSDVSSNSTTVEWGRPDSGQYDGFRLTLLHDDQQQSRLDLDTTLTSHQFTSLQPATKYKVTVEARAETVYSSEVDLIVTTSK